MRWDYAGEMPLSDARGFTQHRLDAHVSQLTDEWEDDPAVANLVLTTHRAPEAALAATVAAVAELDVVQEVTSVLRVEGA